MLQIASDPRNTVVVISGRDRALVSQWLGDLPVWIAAENGIYYRLGKGAQWQQSETVDDVDNDWISSITPVFRYFEERTPGSVTETQEFSITWHYREADDDFGEIQASVLQEHLEKFTEQLSEMTELPVDQMDRTEIVNVTRVTESFLVNLIKGTESGLDVPVEPPPAPVSAK